MTAPRAVATKNTRDDVVASRKQKSTRAVSATVPKTRTRSLGEQSLVQRKENACACGGGCPTCLGTLGVQAKLKIGAPNDVYEQEADRVADQVMRMTEPKVQKNSQANINSGTNTRHLVSKADVPVQRQQEAAQEYEAEELIRLSALNQPVTQRQTDLDEDEEDLLQAKATPGHTPQVTPNVAASIQSLKGGGQPLPANQRRFFESRMGQDFSGVRIHTDSKAADIAQTIQAKAFTLGNNIVFNSGQYSPYNQEGKKLLAHELTHVVQQNGEARLEPKIAPTSFTFLEVAHIPQRKPLREDELQQDIEELRRRIAESEAQVEGVSLPAGEDLRLYEERNRLLRERDDLIAKLKAFPQETPLETPEKRGITRKKLKKRLREPRDYSGREIDQAEFDALGGPLESYVEDAKHNEGNAYARRVAGGWIVNGVGFVPAHEGATTTEEIEQRAERDRLAAEQAELQKVKESGGDAARARYRMWQDRWSMRLKAAQKREKWLRSALRNTLGDDAFGGAWMRFQNGVEYNDEKLLNALGPEYRNVYVEIAWAERMAIADPTTMLSLTRSSMSRGKQLTDEDFEEFAAFAWGQTGIRQNVGMALSFRGIGFGGAHPRFRGTKAPPPQPVAPRGGTGGQRPPPKGPSGGGKPAVAKGKMAAKAPATKPTVFAPGKSASSGTSRPPNAPEVAPGARLRHGGKSGNVTGKPPGKVDGTSVAGGGSRGTGFLGRFKSNWLAFRLGTAMRGFEGSGATSPVGAGRGGPRPAVTRSVEPPASGGSATRPAAPPRPARITVEAPAAPTPAAPTPIANSAQVTGRTRAAPPAALTPVAPRSQTPRTGTPTVVPRSGEAGRSSGGGQNARAGARERMHRTDSGTAAGRSRPLAVRWNDTALTADQAVGLYSRAGVNRPLSETRVRARHQQGWRFNPATRRWSKPHRASRAPTGGRSSYAWISQQAGREQEKVVTAITGWPKNEKSHATSRGQRKPDYLVALDATSGRWIVAGDPSSAHFVADSKYYDQTTVRLDDQIKGFIEIAAQTNPPSGRRHLFFVTNESAAISEEIVEEARKAGVTVVQIKQKRSK